MVDVTKTTLHFFPPLDSRDTVLLLLAVRGAEHMIEPATATYALLNSFFGRGQGALHLATIFFDISTPEGGNLYDNQLAAAVDFIQKYVLTLIALSITLSLNLYRNARRVVVYFITHATPDGDLHFSGPRIVQQNKITQSLPGHSNSPRAVSPCCVLVLKRLTICSDSEPSFHSGTVGCLAYCRGNYIVPHGLRWIPWPFGNHRLGQLCCAPVSDVKFNQLNLY